MIDDPIDDVAFLDAWDCERRSLELAMLPIEAVTPYRDMIVVSVARLAGLLERLPQPMHDKG